MTNLDRFVTSTARKKARPDRTQQTMPSEPSPSSQPTRPSPSSQPTEPSPSSQSTGPPPPSQPPEAREPTGPSRHAGPSEPAEEAECGQRKSRSAVMQKFKWVSGHTYRCEVCREKHPNGTQGLITRPLDGSTNPFWKHFEKIHPVVHAGLKGKEDGSRQAHLVDNEKGQMTVQRSNKRPLNGLTAEETNDVLARLVCACDLPWTFVEHYQFRDMWRYATQRNLDPPSAKVWLALIILFPSPFILCFFCHIHTDYQG